MIRALRTVGPMLAIVAVASAAGAIAARDYRRTLRMHSHEIQTCFETERARAPSFETGWMAMAFAVGPDGRLVEVRTLSASTPRMTAVATCVTTLARAWAFEPSTSGRTMNVRLEFHAASVEPAIQ